ncbi:MAG: VOC family protein [Thiothrix sp.]|nr:VOC family protein [Thiothrix sp.]HPQ94548.1 VOC family protein [Thiolinea sp.]
MMLNGVEFVELASQGGQARWFEQLLSALGFEKTHQHRSKDVALYRQGRINFIVNCEPDSFARRHYEKHGTAVCALGLGTAALPVLVARCRRHHCDFYETGVQPGELEIPAIRTIWDGLLYLVDTAAGQPHFYEVDFEALPGYGNGAEGPAGFGLTRIDHITQAVAPAEFEAQIRFYQVLFDLVANPEYDLHDSKGIVHSRSLFNTDHSVQLPVNTSADPDTSTSRFRQRFSGSGVQHIALRCNDIFSVARHLNPHNILPVPPEYYAALQAEFGLDEKLLARMDAFNILYDQKDGGRFFHIYTRHINGLFFEIVQREHYSGFGERNADTRLAVQEQEYQKMKALLLA